MKRRFILEQLEDRRLLSAPVPPSSDEVGPPAKPPGPQWVTAPQVFMPQVKYLPVYAPGVAPTPAVYVNIPLT
jgi:hypothetical protein